jgi:hypothetical protein
MDRKWFPDFVRIVRDFEYTQTQKVLVRHLKRVHFDLNRTGDDRIFFRERGDQSFRPLGRGEYEQLRKEFEAAEKLDLLDR